MAPSDPGETLVSSTIFKSLGLNALLDTLQDDQTYSILDLGPALEDNVRFWSQFSCKLHIKDFYRSYLGWKATAKPEEEFDKAAVSAILPFSDKTIFDIILAWDIFNYFDLQELAMIVQRLSHYCHPGTMLFAMISIMPNISTSPWIFRILNREQMTLEIATPETIPSPRHQPRDIIKLLAQFNVSCSFLLRQGIQEYVFEFK